MSNCYWCDEPLINDNISEEHIIIQSLGGKLKSPHLLCKKCNSEFGSGLDSKFDGELNYIPIALNIKTKNGNKKQVCMYNKDNEKLLFTPGLKFTN